MLPGRLLTRPQRQAFCVLTESSDCKPKVHVLARAMLLQDPDKMAAVMGTVADPVVPDEAQGEEASHG